MPNSESVSRAVVAKPRVDGFQAQLRGGVEPVAEGQPGVEQQPLRSVGRGLRRGAGADEEPRRHQRGFRAWMRVLLDARQDVACDHAEE